MLRKKALSRAGVLALVAGLLVMALGSPVLLAHDRYDRQYGRHDAYREGQRIGYENGYRHGQNDRYRHLGYNYKSHEYRRGDLGYDRRFGHHKEYRNGFRAGYEAGYNAAYYSRSGYGHEGRRGYEDRGRGQRGGGRGGRIIE